MSRARSKPPNFQGGFSEYPLSVICAESAEVVHRHAQGIVIAFAPAHGVVLRDANYREGFAALPEIFRWGKITSPLNFCAVRALALLAKKNDIRYYRKKDNANAMQITKTKVRQKMDDLLNQEAEDLKKKPLVKRGVNCRPILMKRRRSAICCLLTIWRQLFSSMMH